MSRDYGKQLALAQKQFDACLVAADEAREKLCNCGVALQVASARLTIDTMLDDKKFTLQRHMLMEVPIQARPDVDKEVQAVFHDYKIENVSDASSGSLLFEPFTGPVYFQKRQHTGDDGKQHIYMLFLHVTETLVKEKQWFRSLFGSVPQQSSEYMWANSRMILKIEFVAAIENE